jgi:hypothetical protein
MSLEQVAPIYLPFAGGGFRLSLGLLPVEEYAWLDLGHNLSTELAAKRALLEARHAEVFCALPAADAAAAELLGLFARHLPQHHKATFRIDGNQLLNRATAETWDIAHPSLHSLDIAGRLVAEDICLLQSDGDRPILVGASLCSPARWLLAEKIGRPVSAIHAPVPGYAEALGQPVDRFLAALKPDRLFGRFNWGIADDPTPFQPVAPAVKTDVTPANAGKKLWLRVERQVLRRLPETGAVVFTIRTTITRLDGALRTRSETQDLAATIRGMPPAMQDYKRIAPYATALLGWLDTRASN